MDVPGLSHCLLNVGMVHCLDLGGTPHRWPSTGIVVCLVFELETSRYHWCPFPGSPANTLGDRTSKAGIKPASITLNNGILFMVTHGNLFTSA